MTAACATANSTKSAPTWNLPSWEDTGFTIVTKTMCPEKSGPAKTAPFSTTAGCMKKCRNGESKAIQTEKFS